MSIQEKKPQASPNDEVLIVQKEITAAMITSTDAGNLGHADGVPLVADPGAGRMIELVSVIFEYTRDTATYGGGGNISINLNGSTAVTGVVSAANSLGNGASRLYLFIPLAAAATLLVENKGLNLVAASAFTNPGTAAGTVTVTVKYRVHSL